MSLDRIGWKCQGFVTLKRIIFYAIALSIRLIKKLKANPCLHPCVLKLRKMIPVFRTKTPKTRPGASFTVEAAFVLPLFLFAMLVMLGIFQALQVQSCMSQALQYAARKTAVSYTDASEDKGLSLIVARQMAVGYFRNNGGWTDAIAGGTAGISFLGSDFSGEYVCLCADYRVKLPISFWGIRALPVSQCVRARKWIGATEGGEGAGDAAQGYVYVTEYGTVYHESTNCPYLDLSIRAVSADGVKACRNHSGEKYRACSCSRGSKSDTVYITDYGTEYHRSLSCSHLTRTIHRVERDDVGEMHVCPKCAGGGG